MVIELDDSTKDQILEMFDALVNDVTIHVFVKDHDCLYCNDTMALATQVADISGKVNVTIHKGELTVPEAAGMRVRYTPAIVIHGKDEYKIRYYGIPAGYEFGALIGDIVDASTGTVALPPDVIEDIESIDKPVHLQVFTTPQCPYCPGMVRLAHQAAILNPLIEADMIEALEFQDLSQKYEVFGVPKTIINENVSVEGLTPPELFVEKLFEAVDQI